jgi:hypothetical protein
VKEHEDLLAGFVDEGLDDHVGLWEVVRAVREDLGVSDPAAVRDATLRLVRVLLTEQGLEAGFPTPDGRGFRAWPLDAEESIGRIEREWDLLGRSPSIGEVVWFNNPAEPEGDSRKTARTA